MFVDFDGTLSPIVEDFDAAVPVPAAAPLLGRLADRFARVAVISGRPLAYLERHLAGAGRTELIGIYGLERSGHAPAPEVVRWRPSIEQAAADAEARAPSGVIVERKGLAVTLHYRTAPQHQAWAEEFGRAAAADTGLAVHIGKMSVELRPPVDTDKGTVVRDLSAGLDAVCFIGDDRGDLPAFAALAAMPGADTLAVAVDGPETPPELKAAADLIVDGPDGVVRFLSQL